MVLGRVPRAKTDRRPAQDDPVGAAVDLAPRCERASADASAGLFQPAVDAGGVAVDVAAVVVELAGFAGGGEGGEGEEGGEIWRVALVVGRRSGFGGLGLRIVAGCELCLVDLIDVWRSSSTA